MSNIKTGVQYQDLGVLRLWYPSSSPITKTGKFKI